VRVDGRAFHGFTRGFNRPFSPAVMEGMIYAAMKVVEQMQGFKIGYIQSDEASFVLTDFETLETESWFDYRVNKLNSISASIMSVNFNHFMWKMQTEVDCSERFAYFDARCFNVPLDDVANVLLWRQKDWERNSLQMYCRSFFSQKQLHGKNREAMHEMLHVIGKNWTTDLSGMERNGTFLLKEKGGGIKSNSDIPPNFASINLRVNDTIGGR
jgi:tRNA(His) 5'-end guanylyltransferase